MLRWGLKWGLALWLASWAAVADAQTGLLVSAQAGQLTLSWQDNATNELQFLIERSLPGDVCEFTQVATVGPNVESWIDTPVNPDVRWCYRVRAQNDAGTSAYSNVACGTAPGSTPTSASADFFKDNQHLGPYVVAIDGYSCVRVVGGTNEVRILSGTVILTRAKLAKPAVGVVFTLTCELAPTTITLKIDHVIKLIAPR